MKTSQDVINKALRKLGVLAEDLEPSDAMQSTASAALDGVIWEIRSQAFQFAFTTQFPDEIANALSDLLAAELAPEYPLVRPPVPRSMALGRIMALVRPDDRFIEEYTGTWEIETGDGSTYGYERSNFGRLVPICPGVREVVALPSTGVVRIRPDGRVKLNNLDTIEIRMSSWGADKTLLTWDNVNRQYSVTDAALAAWIVGRVGLTTQLTIRDPDADVWTAANTAYF
jgi:hypothetical protein